MKKRMGIAAVAVIAVTCLTLTACTDRVGEPELEVTYVANAGFIIESGDKKILVDALFGGFDGDWCYQPSDSIIELMKTARPPFDGVDLIAVTHAHVDHLSFEITAAHMRNNRDAILVCPSQVMEMMAAKEDLTAIEDRIRFMSPPDSVIILNIAGIGVKIIPGKHSAYREEDPETGEMIDRHGGVEHFEYVFDAGGRKVYHAGDAIMNDRLRYEALRLDRDSLDVACVGWWSERPMITFREKLIRDLIAPRCVILDHMWPNNPPEGHPEQKPLAAPRVILPKRAMEHWVFSPQ